MNDPVFVQPDWPAPARVRAAVTTRVGGVSEAPFDSFNLGPGSGDDPTCLAENHCRLHAALGLPSEPVWLRQVHGGHVIRLSSPRADGATSAEPSPGADAAWTDQAGTVCAVLTADCLPVLLCTRSGGAVAAVHCGWRGLAAGVLTNAIRAMSGPASELMAWLGPAIGPEVYEVGPEVRQAFVERGEATSQAFRPGADWNRFYCDLYAIAHIELHEAGVRDVYGGGFCTYSDRERFFSYRRDGRTGRMASLIWMGE